MIDITGLKEYAQAYPEVLGKLFNKNTVLNELVPHTGANPGPYRLRLYEADGNLGECCTVPNKGSSISEVETEVACILSGNEFCDADMGKALGDAKFRYTAGKENAGSLEELFMDQELAAVARNIDKLVFQGDASSSDENLNKFDGLVKQTKAGGVEVSITSDVALDAVEQVLLSLPEDAEEMGDIAVFVSNAFGRKLKSELMRANLFHYDFGDQKASDSFVMPGFSNVRIIPTRGLNGTKNIIATPLNNIHWITNLENDHMDLDWDYDKYHQVYYWRVKFILGVTLGFADYSVIGELTTTRKVGE